MTFREELESLINRNSKEKGSDTPDFILAAYLDAQLKLFDATVKDRERWYGRAVGADKVSRQPEARE